jgi:hypothetical protein
MASSFRPNHFDDGLWAFLLRIPSAVAGYFTSGSCGSLTGLFPPVMERWHAE